MIRHFSPFHAPLTPPLMGMDSDNSALERRPREQRPIHCGASEGLRQVWSVLED